MELRSRCGCRQTLALSRIGEGDLGLRVLNCSAGNSDGYTDHRTEADWSVRGWR